MLIFCCGLMNHLINLKLRQKRFLQAQQKTFVQSKWPGLKKKIIISLICAVFTLLEINHVIHKPTAKTYTDVAVEQLTIEDFNIKK